MSKDNAPLPSPLQEVKTFEIRLGKGISDEIAAAIQEWALQTNIATEARACPFVAAAYRVTLNPAAIGFLNCCLLLPSHLTSSGCLSTSMLTAAVCDSYLL